MTTSIASTTDISAVPNTAVSADGTIIGWHRSGRGPAAVLLHGTSGEKSNWGLSSQFLQEELTLIAVDRRGRGRSGPGEPYAFEREIEDVAAVVEALGETPHLVGHSFGGALALAAVTAGVPARSLVLYEPATMSMGESLDFDELAAACDTAIAAGDPDGCLTTFYDAIGESSTLELMRSWPPIYEKFRRDAHTIGREIRAALVSAPNYGDGLAADVDQPVLLLHGSESRPGFKRACQELATRLPNAELTVMEGQGHLGPAFAPEPFAELVLDFTRRH